MERAVGVIRLFRPINSLMMGFAVIVGALLVADNAIFAYPSKLSLGLLTGFTLTGSQMAVNDYYDREIDLINEPRRPIPSGLVKPYEAVYYASILGFIGLTAALLTNITCFIVAVISYLISLGYVTEGKRTGFPGNLMVSTCIAVPFLYGALAIGAEVEPILLVFMAMVFLSNTGREVTKGIVDVVGDRSRGVKTLAFTMGERTAALISALLYVLAVGLSAIPWVLGLVSVWYLPFVILADTGFIYSSISILRDSSRENARRVKGLVLVWMLFGLLGFAFG